MEINSSPNFDRKFHIKRTFRNNRMVNRKDEVAVIRSKFPNKVPLMVYKTTTAVNKKQLFLPVVTRLLRRHAEVKDRMPQPHDAAASVLRHCATLMSATVKNQPPSKPQVIVDRFYKEMSLPQLDKTKFLVPQEITMSQFVTIIRNRMQLGSTQAFYLLVNNRSILSLSKTMAEVYSEHQDDDGFLHVTYASQEVFGCDSAGP